MAILTYPLNGVLYDAEDAETYLCTRTSGVFASDGHFPASVTGSRQVTIGPGLAWMQNEEFHGKAIYNPENVTLTIAEADAYQTRIDRIVLRFDKLLNMTELTVLQGTPGGGAPAITRDSLTYDLGLYTVTVKNSTASLSASDVASTMLDESVCGIMEDAVTSIPTQELYDQWYAWFADLQTDTEAFETQFNLWFEQIKEEADQYMTDTKNEFEVWMNGSKVDFDTWFDSVQDTLDSDVAGHLTNLVNDAQDTADEALEQLITGTVRGFMTEEYEGGEYGLQADDSDDSHAITLSKNICDCEGNTSADMSMISDEFNEKSTYKEGDYCIYENTLFVFTADKSAGSWNWNCVQETNVATELKNQETELKNQETELKNQETEISGKADALPIGSFEERIWTAGVLTTSTSALYFSIPISKSLGTISSIEVNEIYVRQNGSYLADDLTGGWELAFNQYTSLATILLTKSDGWGGTNNDTVGVWARYTVTIGDSDTISPQGFPDDDGNDNPDDDTKTAPGPEIIDPDDDGNDNPDDSGNTGTLEPGEIIPDDEPAPDNPEEVE